LKVGERERTAGELVSSGKKVVKQSLKGSEERTRRMANLLVSRSKGRVPRKMRE